MKKQTKITSRGRITVPREICLALGVRAGDMLLFEQMPPEFASSLRAQKARLKSIAVSKGTAFVAAENRSCKGSVICAVDERL